MVLTTFTLILTTLIAAIVGILIGAIGIGGVLLVPTLTYMLGLGIHVAIATTMFTYLFSGAVGALEYARQNSIHWSMALWLCLGGMPGAYLGAATTWVTPGVILEGVIGFLVLLSGVQALRGPSDTAESVVNLKPMSLMVIGLATGFGSSITGTGGPLVLIPILIWMQVPILTAVGLSQVIQIPIALLATAGNLTFGRIEWLIGMGIATLLVLGVVVGARIAHRISRVVLKRFIAFALLLVGAAMLMRTAASFI
jgi:hypothetical protein